MSDNGINPYAAGVTPPTAPPTTVFPPYLPVTEVRRVEIRPFELFKRGYALMGEQYWLFVGITALAMIVGSAIPFGLILGCMFVGIFFCFMQREAGQHVEIGTLFKGFDKFQESVIAFLIIMAATMAISMVFAILILIAVVATGLANDTGIAALGVVAILLLYVCLFAACAAIYIPFLFTFQLIADRGLSGTDAIKASWMGVKKNLAGIVVFLFLNTIISLAAAMMCYFPAFLFMPITFSAMYVLYRDVYGPRPEQLAQDM